MHTIPTRIVVIQRIVFYEAKKHSWHAEQLCIKKCQNKKLLRKATMYLVKISHAPDVKPCSMCQRIIDKYAIRRIISVCV